MKCWECGKEGTKQFELKKASEFCGFDMVSQRWYCEECYERIEKERKHDLQEYIRLKKKLMYERAVKAIERQNIELYEYKEALDAVKEFTEEHPDKFDSSHEMIAAAMLIYDEIPVKVHYMIAGSEVDFYLPSLKAVLEVDGDLYHKGHGKRDAAKDAKVRSELGNDHEVIRIDTKFLEQNAKMLVEAIVSMRDEMQKVRRQNYGILPEWFTKRKQII